jgi:hypothetical protein
MKHFWVIPLVFLIILFGAWHYRWDETASKTVNNVIQKYKVDRWTGQMWLVTYRGSNVQESPISASSAFPWEERNQAMFIWQWMVGINVFLFVYLCIRESLKTFKYIKLLLQIALMPLIIMAFYMKFGKTYYIFWWQFILAISSYILISLDLIGVKGLSEILDKD